MYIIFFEYELSQEKGAFDMTKRRCTRSRVWANTGASIKVRYNTNFDNRLKFMTIKGEVENLGAGGMFFCTDEFVPVPALAKITIHFDSESSMPGLFVTASGRIVRMNKKGVGIKFLSIDLKKLQTCIIKKINRSVISECEPDTII